MTTGRLLQSAPLFALFCCFVVGGAPAAGAAGSGPSEAREELLSSGALARSPNPAVLDFLVQEGRELLPEEQRRRALDQVVDALREETLVRPLADYDLGGMLQGTLGSAMREAAHPENLLRWVLGARPRPDPGRGKETGRRIEGMLTDPWVRGLDAARALSRAGYGAEAEDFFRGCMQWTFTAGWLQVRCTEEAIASLGVEGAHALFAEMLERPYMDLGIDFRALGVEPPEQEPVPQIEAAALKGFGRLLAGGDLDPARTDQVMDALIGFTANRREDRLVIEAAVEALAASQHPRAVVPLRKFAKGGKSGLFSRRPEVSEGVSATAQRALAVVFGDRAAIERLERDLRRGSPAERYAAGRALVLAGEDAGYDWARRYLGRQTIPIKQADLRPAVVRTLVHAGSGRSRSILTAQLEQGHESDWLEAWIAAALVELGDTSRIGALGAALDRERWDLGRRTAGLWFRMVKPLVWEGLKTAAGLPPQRLDRVVLDFAFAARDRAIVRQHEQERRTVRLRWQIADSLGAVDDPAAVPVLARLLEDESEAARLSAAASLLEQTDPAAAAAKGRALGLDFGDEAGESRNPEIHATVLRNLLRRHGEHPATREAVRVGSRSRIPSVRFIALAALVAGSGPPEAEPVTWHRMPEPRLPQGAEH